LPQILEALSTHTETTVYPTTKVPTKKILLVPFSGSEPKFLVIFPLNLSFFVSSPKTSGKGREKRKEKKLSLVHFRTKQNIKCPGNWKSNNPI
jgi:hypothetical protein